MFGCVSYVHINPNERSKQDAKANKYFFIGYGHVQYGYRFWDERNWKIIKRRNMTFDEKTFYKDKLSDIRIQVEGWSLKQIRICQFGHSKGLMNRRNQG